VGVWKYSGPERLCEVIGQNTSDWYDSVPSPRRIGHASGDHLEDEYSLRVEDGRFMRGARSPNLDRVLSSTVPASRLRM
jgi:hypothetical protein